jgi:hypothetical protein
MIPCEDMPEDNQDLANTDVSFPYLRDNSPASCPVKIEKILEYLELEGESVEFIKKEGLKFIRTAQVAKEKYCIWEFFDSENKKCYVTVSKSRWGRPCISYDEDYYGLTPEQFILGDYHNVF